MLKAALLRHTCGMCRRRPTVAAVQRCKGPPFISHLAIYWHNVYPFIHSIMKRLELTDCWFSLSTILWSFKSNDSKIDRLLRLNRSRGDLMNATYHRVSVYIREYGENTYNLLSVFMCVYFYRSYLRYRLSAIHYSSTY